eukprot:TRINITY_DN25057_c1_g1_i4.p1 TRINITY_DN25057_c1_g1~~TRINITY_DN25057_c1_g1_i4.p1  ORF type:complete len:158 (-),score=10.10 TRINITY_DN25057_c1_g1_i4:703-1176(-)
MLSKSCQQFSKNLVQFGVVAHTRIATQQQQQHNYSSFNQQHHGYYVWDDIIRNCSTDPAVLNRTARVLHSVCNRASGGPPIEYFNELVRICSYHQDFEALQKLTDILETTGMTWNINTHRYLLETYQYADRYHNQLQRLTTLATQNNSRKTSSTSKQ